MNIIYAVALDKSLTVPGKNLDKIKPWRTIYELTENEYFNDQKLIFQNIFY